MDAMRIVLDGGLSYAEAFRRATARAHEDGLLPVRAMVEA